MLLKATPINLEGVAAVISNKIVPVEEYCAGLASPKKLRKIIAGTGFESLSIAENDVCCSDMCFQAAEHLFNEGGFDRDSIGALIFVSQSPDYRNPATAYILQKRLNLGSDLIAFDIGLGCSGFVYGLYVASSMLNNLGDRKVMLFCGDVGNWRHKKPTNLSSAVLFGDVGACAIVSRKQSDEEILFNIHSYGDRWHYLFSEDGGTRLIKQKALNSFDFEGTANGTNSHMDGMKVMEFTLFESADNIKELIVASGLDKNDIGAYLFHQPQKLLIDDMAERLGLDSEKVIANAQNIGNGSSASIPLLLTEIGSAWSERPNKKVLMSGFGVGLSVASVIMDLDNTVCLETKHYERSDV